MPGMRAQPESGDQVVGSHAGQSILGIRGTPGNMRRQHRIRQTQQSRVNDRLLFKYIQSGCSYLWALSASARAASSIKPPRAILNSMAEGFIRLSSAAPIRW